MGWQLKEQNTMPNRVDFLLLLLVLLVFCFLWLFPLLTPFPLEDSTLLFYFF